MRINMLYSLCSVIKKSFKNNSIKPAKHHDLKHHQRRGMQSGHWSQNKRPEVFSIFHPQLALSQGETGTSTLMFHSVLTDVLN